MESTVTELAQMILDGPPPEMVQGQGVRRHILDTQAKRQQLEQDAISLRRSRIETISNPPPAPEPPVPPEQGMRMGVSGKIIPRRDEFFPPLTPSSGVRG